MIHASLENFDIDVCVKAPMWIAALDTPEAFCQTVIYAALEGLSPDLKLEPGNYLSIALMDDASVQALNKTYRQKDKPTNVLSFPSMGPGPELGEIVLAFETCEHEARRDAKAFCDHVSHLLVHGLLHLYGYTHESDDKAHKMETLEIKLLAAMNIDNPYPDTPI